VMGLAAYQLEKLARPHVLHPTIVPRLGFNAHLHDARTCADAASVIDLVLASSATPPFTREGRYGGARLLDGSLVDNAPAFALDGRAPKTVVLLTRPYPKGALGVRNGRLYLAPTEPVPAHRWDYRESAPVDETIALGERDAERHGEALERYLAS
jgi:predicted acylesterase/phospholipase RssA